MNLAQTPIRFEPLTKAPAQIEPLTDPQGDSVRTVVEANSGYLSPERVRPIVQKITDLRQVLDLANDLTNFINHKTANTLGILENDPQLTNNFRQPRAVERAIGGTVPDIGLVDEVRRPFVESIALPKLFVPKLESAEDIDQLGAFRHAIEAVFWNRMNALRHWTLEPGLSRQYDLMTGFIHGRKREQAEFIKQTAPHLIHSLRAKDSNKIWTYYNVFVMPDVEQSFLNALKRQDAINLEDFGQVVSSAYVEPFNSYKLSKAHRELSSWINRYESLTERKRTYWILSGDFSRDWQVVEAEREKGNYEDITRDISRTRVGSFASSKIVRIAHERKLSLGNILELAEFFIDFEEEKISAKLETIIQLTRIFCPDEDHFEWMCLTIIQNPAIDSADKLRQVIPYDGPLEDDYLEEVLRHIVFWHVLLEIFPIKTQLARLCLGYSDMDEESRGRSCSELFAEVAGGVHKLTFTQELVAGDEVGRHGIALGSEIIARLAILTHDISIDQKARDNVVVFIKRYGIVVIGKICYIGRFIEQEYTDRVAFIAELLSRSLEPVFEKTDFPEDRRASLVAEITGRLLNRSVTPSRDTWAERVRPSEPVVSTERPLPSGSIIFEGREIPEKAPVLWKDARKFWQAEKEARRIPPDEELTPPNFIKRVYCSWLKPDASGLIRPDLKVLDREERPDGSYLTPLYTALKNWLRTNNRELPEDCPLPTKSAWIDKKLEDAGDETPASVKDWERIRNARRKRSSQL